MIGSVFKCVFDSDRFRRWPGFGRSSAASCPVVINARVALGCFFAVVVVLPTPRRLPAETCVEVPRAALPVVVAFFGAVFEVADLETVVLVRAVVAFPVVFAEAVVLGVVFVSLDEVLAESFITRARAEFGLSVNDLSFESRLAYYLSLLVPSLGTLGLEEASLEVEEAGLLVVLVFRAEV